MQMAEIDTGVTVGRPPLPEEKRRRNRRVALFTDEEIAEIDAYMERESVGVNDLLRDSVLAVVRRKPRTKPSQ